MKTHLQNVTVTLEEGILRWTRMEAAHRGISVSQLLADILKKEMENDSYQAAMRLALARKSFLKSAGHYLSREELHDRTRFRGIVAR